MNDFRWERHLDTERVFSDMGLKVPKILKIPMKLLDLKESIAQNLRLGRQFEAERSDQIFISLKNSELPTMAYLVLLKVGSVYIVVAGNHRAAGLKKFGLDHVMAYVLDQDIEPSVLLNLRAMFNKYGGKGNTKAELIALAVAVFHETHEDKSVIAKRYGVSVASIDESLRAEKTRNSLAGSNVSVKNLPRNTLDALQPLTDNTKVLNAAARTVVDFKLTASEAKDLTARVKAERGGEAAKLHTITTYAAEHGPAPEGPRKRRPGNRSASRVTRQLITAYNSLYALLTRLKPKSAMHVGLTAAQAKAIAEKWGTIQNYSENIGATTSTGGTRRKQTAKKATATSRRG